MTRPPLLAALAALTLSACGDGKTDAAPKAAAVEAPPAAVLGAPRLGADGLPRFRPRLWEVVTLDNTSDEGPVTSRQCLGEEANTEMREALAAGDTPNCRRTRSVGANGLTIKATCSQGEVNTEMQISLSGSETAYTMVMDLRSKVAGGEPQGGRIEGNARWIGACPAGMKPGDETADSDEG
jgi:hypothetical protein